MTVGKKNRIWLRAVIISSALVGAASPTTALGGEPIQRLGRNFGLGWGDGYHACADSGVRVGADLPPRSFADAHGARLHHQRPFTGMGHRQGTTFYDRFDADGANCCDSACDSMANDLPARTLIQDSQVFRGHSLPPTPHSNIASDSSRPQKGTGLDSPSRPKKGTGPDSPSSIASDSSRPQKGPVPNSPNSVPQKGPVPNSVPNSVSGPVPDLSSDLSLPVPDLRFGGESKSNSGLVSNGWMDGLNGKTPTFLSEKQYPIRPQPPALPNSHVTPLAANRAPTTLPLTGQDPGQSFATRIIKSDANPLPSKTPLLIEPVHPSDRAAPILASGLQRPPHLGTQQAIKSVPPSPNAPTMEPKQAAVPTPQMPSDSKPTTRLMRESLAADSLESDPPPSATVATTAPSVNPSPDSLVIAPPQTRLVFPKAGLVSNPRSTSPVAEAPSKIVANQLIPEPAKSDAVSKALKEEPKQLEAEGTVDAYSLSTAQETPATRPHRLGSSTGTLPSVKPRSVYQQKSPDGVDEGLVRANPFASRPTVQLAKRPSASSEGVIYQPTSTPASQQR